MSHKIILNSQDEVTCPHCEKQFPLRDGLTQQLIERYEDEYDVMLAQEKAQLEASIGKELERKQRKAFESRMDELKEQLAESREAAEKGKKLLDATREKAAAAAREEALAEATTLKEELAEKDKKLADFRATELELRKQKKAVEEQQAELALELERKLEAERKSIEAKVNEAFSLREAELRKKISDAKKTNEELTRKLEQGSQQLQGEVLELEIESILQQAYPFDEIDPVRKGARGADVIQSIRLRSGTRCGTIVWESKRAENWSNNWIPKLKEDLQAAGGDIAVLVTTTFPADISESMLMHEGVWLVTPNLVKGLSEALRTVLIETQRQKSISAGKGEQVEALFDYICSNQFAQRIRSVVEGYEEMSLDLEKEKNAMQRLWKKREGQISRITSQVLNICGELQGISSAALPHLDSVASLDFDDGEKSKGSDSIDLEK